MFTFNTNKPRWAAEDLSLVTEPSTNLTNTNQLYKCGRATGYTAGNYGVLKEARVANTIFQGRVVEQRTREHVVVGCGESFSRPGDSGALVFTRTGVVMGMVIGGHMFENISYMTTIDDLIEDIKSTTGAADVRILPRYDEEG